MLRKPAYLSLLLCACSTSQTAAPTKEPAKPIISRSQAAPSLAAPKNDRLNPAVRPTAYALRLDLDPKRADYGGQVRIDIQLTEPTDIIWLHSEKHEIYAHGLSLGGKRVQGATIARAEPDWLAIQLPKTYGPSKGTLTLQFRGEMTTPLFGLYRVEHDGEWYIYTQFESLGARKAFPCFDEPGFKATFSVQIRSPQSDSAFSNAPLTQAAKDQGKWKRHEFKTTPPLPTYLVAMAVGPMDIAHNPEFDLKRADGSSLRIRILTPKGKAPLATLALRETAPILKLEEAYFGSPYPFAKLDLVAVPDFAAGAMENPGLITYRDRLLLMDEKTVTQRELQSFADTHAHELAHIWFGDLVTMKWWDDLWLNEAFATWFAAKIVHQYRPDWQVPIDKLGGKTWVMNVDSTSAARRIREPIISRGDILNAFDGITYTKGAAILQMFEGLIGETAFRDGVRAYLKEKAWGSATFADLAKALATSSGRPELPAAIAGFLDQAGVPLIGLRRDQANSLSLSQSRWSPLGKAKLEGGPWALPFCWRGLAQSKSTCRLLGAEQTVPGTAGALLPNPNMLSYAVWKLPSDELEELLGSFQTLSEMEQVAVLQNLRKLYRSGDLSPSTLQRITPNLLLSEHERVVSTALSLHGELGRLVNDEQIDAWKKLRNALIGGLLKRYGWGEANDKDSARWRLRNQVLSIAGHAGHRPKVIAEAKVISDAFLKGQSVSRETLSTALSISAEHGDEALFDQMLSQLLSSNDVRRRNSLRGALGRFRFDRVVERLFALVDHKELRANERSGMLWPVAGDHRTRVEAWQRLKPLLPKLNALLPRRGMRYLPYFPGSACRESLDSELVEAFKPWIQKVDGIERHLKSARENLQQCLALRRAYGDELIEILAP